jgi:adenylate cyclase
MQVHLPQIIGVKFLPVGDSAAAIISASARESRPDALGEASPAPQTALHRQRVCVTFVDIVGFSAMMNRDEEQTFHKWTGLREGVLMPLLKSHGGTLIKSTGDGILGTFPDAVSGARWGQEVQRRARRERQGLALRISLNFCSVLRDGEDLIGDGVNIAARLQEHAKAGGIIVTESVYREIQPFRDFDIRPIGNLQLRKIPQIVPAFEIVTDGRFVGVAVDVAQRPSVAVLPFQNLGTDPADEFFAVGLVEDIVQSLSSLRELTVISRSSTLAFARQSADPRAIGEALSVQYVITGTVRRSGGKGRISTELLDAQTGEQISSERHEFSEQDTFQIQDEIVLSTLKRLLPGLQAAERRKALRKWPESFTAYENFLRALDLIGSLERGPFEQAYGFLERAIEQDPGFAAPLAWSARWHTLNVGQGWSSDPRGDAEKAANTAKRAIGLDEQNALALAVYGHVQSYLFGDFATAIRFLDRAREQNPNNSTAWLLSSVTLSSLGRNEEAVGAALQALRLSPFDQHLFIYYAFLGIVYYDSEDYGAAIKWLSQSLAENPRYTSSLRTLAVALVADGRLEEAREVARKLMKLEPGFNLSDYRKSLRLYEDPEKSELFRKRLSLAAVPD